MRVAISSFIYIVLLALFVLLFVFLIVYAPFP